MRFQFSILTLSIVVTSIVAQQLSAADTPPPLGRVIPGLIGPLPPADDPKAEKDRPESAAKEIAELKEQVAKLQTELESVQEELAPKPQMAVPEDFRLSRENAAKEDEQRVQAEQRAVQDEMNVEVAKKKKEDGKRVATSDVELKYTRDLGVAILLFGGFTLGLVTFIFTRERQSWSTDATRIAGLTILVTAGAFLTTAGYSQTQIGPMVGFLGTAAGFLLGKGSADGEKKT